MTPVYRPRGQFDAAVKALRCRAAVNRHGRVSQCARRHVIDGKWCRQHDPKAQAERTAARHARWEAGWEAQRRENLASAIGHEALRLGIESVEGLRARVGDRDEEASRG